MKLLILSDLHQEGGRSYDPPPGLAYDAVVLAGDIRTPGHKAVYWAARESKFQKPVLMVAGNHEFYHREAQCELEEMKKAAEGSNVHFLHRTSVVIDGVRFLGCTLWTDFQLPVLQPDGSLEVDINRALLEANKRMFDFKYIEVLWKSKNPWRERKSRRLLEARDTLGMHWEERDWLQRELEKPFGGPTVVVTHHAPSMQSVAARWAADWLTPAFVNDLPDEFFQVPALWVHGHTHSAFDYRHGNCRVVSNPRGYNQPDGSLENHRFDAGFVVEVPTAADGRCLLFIDFDGVLHPAPGSPAARDSAQFCHLDLLQSWLLERPTVDVVISSSWGQALPFEELQGFFSEELQPRVLGATRALQTDFWAQTTSDRRPVFEREAEVRQWLREHAAAHRPWIALDDQAGLFAPLSEHLVLCDGRVGLTQRELDLADEVLARSGAR